MPAEPPMQSAPVVWWRRPLVCVAMGVVVGAAVMGTAWGLSGPSVPGVFTLRGGLVLDSSGTTALDDTRCAGDDGYSDITQGAEVTVYDAAGRTVATGELAAGQLSGDSCVFTFKIPGVPKGSRFYSVEVTHRGKITVSAHDAQTKPVAETLGS